MFFSHPQSPVPNPQSPSASEASKHMATAVATEQQLGKVIQVIGPVVDVQYETGHLPSIYNAIRITGQAGGATVDIICEVQQHLGEGRVRAVAMKPTDGLQRGMAAIDTGAPITVPVGPA